MEHIIAELSHHARQHNLKERALRHCREYLEKYRAEYPEELIRTLGELTYEELDFVWTKHFLVFEDDVRHWPRIMTQIQIGERCKSSINGIWPRAFYELETLWDGSINDDWFRWESVPSEILD